MFTAPGRDATKFTEFGRDGTAFPAGRRAVKSVPLHRVCYIKQAGLAHTWGHDLLHASKDSRHPDRLPRIKTLPRNPPRDLRPARIQQHLMKSRHHLESAAAGRSETAADSPIANGVNANGVTIESSARSATKEPRQTATIAYPEGHLANPDTIDPPAGRTSEAEQRHRPHGTRGPFDSLCMRPSRACRRRFDSRLARDDHTSSTTT